MSDIQNLYIDLDLKENLLVTVNCKQFDNLNLIFNIWNSGLQVDLSNYRCRLKALKQDQIPLIQNTGITINNNVVNITSDEQLTTTSGVVLTELQFIDKTTGEKKSTFNLNIKVIASVLEVDRTISVATVTLLQELDNKLDEIEDIGDVLDTAKIVKADLENEIITVNTLKSNLDSSISTANYTKIGLDTSNINANNSKTALETATTNAETKKQEVITECVVADQKIATMQSFGDVTQLTENVTALKTEVETARGGEANFDSRLDKFDADLSEKAKQIDLNTTNINLAQLSNPSLLINDNFQVWQRGTSFSNVSTYEVYTADRWRIDTSGGSVASVIKDDAGAKFTINTNGSFSPLFVQEVEIPNSIKGKKVTLSGEFSTVNGNFTLRLQHYTNSIHTGFDIPIASNGKYSVSVDIPSNVSRLYAIIGSNATTTNGSYVIVKNIKSELGSIATLFVPRLYGEELALCMRYYFRNLWKTLKLANITATQLRTCEYNYPVPMRVSPTIRALIPQPLDNIYTFDFTTIVCVILVFHIYYQ